MISDQGGKVFFYNSRSRIITLVPMPCITRRYLTLGFFYISQLANTSLHWLRFHRGYS